MQYTLTFTNLTCKPITLNHQQNKLNCFKVLSINIFNRQRFIFHLPTNKSTFVQKNIAHVVDVTYDEHFLMKNNLEIITN